MKKKNASKSPGLVPGEVLRRRFGTAEAGAIHILDAVSWKSGRNQMALRVLTRTGTPPQLFDTAPREGCAAISELREAYGATEIIAEAAKAKTYALALAGGATLALDPSPAEWDILDGRNCLLGFRLEQGAATVAEWLDYHATQHGANGAVIINRAPPGSPAGSAEAFAAELAAAIAGLNDMRVIVVDCDVPLGKPDYGPESHPYLAPDAPGKSRMTPPDPDPWRAPLGEGLVHEAMKWRFLAKARAVLCLDVTDLLVPREGEEPAFDLCADAPNGVMMLTGQRIYAWRARDPDRPRFADHICRPFDHRRGIARWGVAPKVAGLDKTWRQIRIAYLRPGLEATIGFWRAMALRVPGRKAGELAPKTSLIEDPALLDMSARLFGHKPIRPPVSAPREAPAQAAGAGRTCIVTTMKNEGPFILEWIAYHRAIGVEDFLIYTNDCTDGTDEMLDLLQARGIVQHRDNPYRAMDLRPQHAALQAAEAEPLLKDCAWGICMDVDEYIDIKIGDGTLNALYAAMGEANMISLTWRLFGNGDIHHYEDRPVIEQFSQCAPEIVRKPHQAWGFKTLFRNIEIYSKLGVHRPKGLRPDLWDQVRWLNGSGRPMPQDMYRNGWRSSIDTYGYDWVQLNHYAVRSAESFLVKRDRGRVNHVDRDQGLNYWFRMNHNAVDERSIQRMLPATRAEMDRLLAFPEIAAVHAKAVAHHRAKIAELRERPDNVDFYRELTGARMEGLSKILHVFGSNVFNAGPDVIPADMHLRDLPPNYYFTVEFDGDARH